MESCTTSIIKNGKNKSNKNIIEDADAELALALSMSATSEHFAATGYQVLDEFAMQHHLMYLKEQEEADASYARQLAAEYNQDETFAYTSETKTNLELGNPEHSDGGDDMDAIIEKIARMEVQECLKSTGHAYHGKTNINRILADEEEEEDRIRKKLQRHEELRALREERARQDAEFEITAKYDRLQEELSRQARETPIIDVENTLEQEQEQEPEPEPELVPLTKEELRSARLAFYVKKKPQHNDKSQ